MKTLQEKVQIVKESGITKETINTLTCEIIRIEGGMEKVGITDQESMITMLVKFVQELDGKIENIYGGGLKKILSV
jgi:hypothetical protein